VRIRRIQEDRIGKRRIILLRKSKVYREFS